MTVAAALVCFLAFVAWRLHRRAHRKDVRAGLISAKPTFVTEPPTRSLLPRSRETL